MGIFDKRENYKPFEYPEIMQFVDSMNKSFWVHSEVEFTADIQDFKSWCYFCRMRVPPFRGIF